MNRPGLGGAALLAGVLAGSALLSGCRRPPAAVGVLVPRSGELAPWGEQVLAGVFLAWEREPAERRPRLLVEDDGGSPLTAARAYGALADAGATVILGPLSTDAALAAGVVARERRVPMLTPTATGEDVTRENAWVLRLCASDAEIARALAVQARYGLALSRLAVVVDLSSRHSLGLAGAFAREFQLRRGRIVGEVAYHAGDGRRAQALDEVVALQAEGVLLAAAPDDVRAMLEGALDPGVAGLVLLGMEGWGGDALARVLAGRVAGAWTASHYSAEEQRPSQQSFLQAWRAQHADAPGDSVALGHDAARAVLQAFDANLDGNGMRRRLRELQPLEGATGTIQLEPRTTPGTKTLVLEQLHDPTRPRFVRRIDT